MELTYRISTYPPDEKMSEEKTKLEIREAFRVWSRVTDLRFTERSYGPVHINITFTPR